MARKVSLNHLNTSKTQLLANGGYRWRAGGITWEYEGGGALLLEMVAGKVRSAAGVFTSVTQAQAYAAGYGQGYEAGKRAVALPVMAAQASQALASQVTESEG